jgi:hypothetical protein
VECAGKRSATPLFPTDPAWHWTLTTLREKLIETGAKVVRDSKPLLNRAATLKNGFWALKNGLTSEAAGGKSQKRPVKLQSAP